MSEYDLERFVDAQDADGIYERALRELRAGLPTFPERRPGRSSARPTR